MTDKEVLEYSKQIVDTKKEIENSETTAPDLVDQVRAKFAEDSVNRAKFIDSTLVIAGATKEFRNVFGVDAPHYELSRDCYLAIDENNNNRYEEDERIAFEDPMNDNISSKTFIDCWDMINAAKFDSTTTAPDDNSTPDSSLPVNRQRFFVDKKAADKGSPAHNPICPPGYDKWAGRVVYDYICKNFDLTESVLYRILSNPKENTIPFDFSLGTYDGTNQFEYNINEKGLITRNKFKYDYEDDSYMMEAYNDPQFRLQKDGCVPTDEEPIKWYTINIPVTSLWKNGRYCYQYNWDGTIFAKSRNPISYFRIVRTNGEELNHGYSVFCLDPVQMTNLPYSGSNQKFFEQIRYCVHVIYKSTDILGTEPNEEQPRRFLWWSWTRTVRHTYNVNFTPITSLSNDVKRKFAEFIRKMEDECVFYYEFAEDRKVGTNVPDLETSIARMKAVRDAASEFLKIRLFPSATKWKNLIEALKNRVLYSIYKNVENYSGSTSKQYSIGDPVLHYDINDGYIPYYCIKPTTGGNWDPENCWTKIFANGRVITTNEAILEWNGQTTFITSWYSNWIPGWPRWLRRLFKRWSSPVYQNFDNLTLKSKSIYRNIEYVNKRSGIVDELSYQGPKSKDFTKLFDNFGSMTTLYALVNEIMSEEDREYLISQEILNSDLSEIKINGSWRDVGTETNSTKIQLTYQKIEEERPPYDNVARAQEIDIFLSSNPSLYDNAFITLSNRINKRTGTLRKLCTLLESANINRQMIEQRKRNISTLFGYINAYEITGGFSDGQKDPPYVVTIKLAGWEPYTSAYANLERMGTVFVLGDTTKIQYKDEKGNIIDKFIEGTYIKTRITEIVDMISDVQYTYEVTKSTEVDPNITYYVYDEQTMEYTEASASDLRNDNLNNLYERTGISSGPIFNVTLQDPIPESFKGRNPRLVKIY